MVLEKTSPLFLENWLNTKLITKEKLENSLRNPNAKMWFDFAISTNERGRHLAKLTKPYLNKRASRYLEQVADMVTF